MPTDKKNPKPYNFLGPETDRENALYRAEIYMNLITLLPKFLGSGIPFTKLESKLCFFERRNIMRNF